MNSKLKRRWVDYTLAHWRTTGQLGMVDITGKKRFCSLGQLLNVAHPRGWSRHSEPLAMLRHDWTTPMGQHIDLKHLRRLGLPLWASSLIVQINDQQKPAGEVMALLLERIVPEFDPDISITPFTPSAEVVTRSRSVTQELAPLAR